VQAVAASPRLARMLAAQVRASCAISTAASVEAADDLRAATRLCAVRGHLERVPHRATDTGRHAPGAYASAGRPAAYRRLRRRRERP
jgi:hypothetical protein